MSIILHNLHVVYHGYFSEYLAHSCKAGFLWNMFRIPPPSSPPLPSPFICPQTEKEVNVFLPRPTAVCFPALEQKVKTPNRELCHRHTLLCTCSLPPSPRAKYNGFLGLTVAHLSACKMIADQDYC